MTITTRRPLQLLPLLLAAVLLLLASQNGWANSFTATVDRQNITENETLTIRLRLEGTTSPSSKPNISVLEKSFEVLSSNQSSNYQSINGRVQSYTDWVLTLLPKSTGKLLVPSIQYESNKTSPIAIHVKKEKAIAGHLKPMMLETKINKTEAFVQEQLILTYRLFYSENVSNLKIAPLQLDGVRIETDLPRTDYTKTIGHTRYDIAEFHVALIPEASGEYTIPAQSWTLNSSAQPNFQRFGINPSRIKVHRLKTKEIKFSVKPRPDVFPNGATWLPARKLTISERWDQPITEFRAGEPITRSVIIEAEGLSGEQLPQIITSRGNADFKFYEDKPKITSQPTAQGINGQRVEKVAVVPSRGGKLILPAIDIAWWDTVNNELKFATLAEKTLSVKPVESVSTSTPLETATTAVLPNNLAQSDDIRTVTNTKPTMPQWWGILMLGLVLSNAILALMWLKQRKLLLAKKQNTANHGLLENVNEKQAFAELKATIDNAEARDAREALLAWMSIRWPDQLCTLDILAKIIDKPELNSELQRLDASLFSHSTHGDWQGQKLIELLSQWRTAESVKTKSSANAQLRPLYA